MKRFLKYFVSILIVFYCNTRISAQVKRSEIVGSYIYNFANNIIWENNSFTEFKLVVLTSDSGLIAEFTKMSKKQKIQSKNISLTILSNATGTFQNTQLIFIAEDMISNYMTVFDKVEGQEILLVSENFDNQSYVMLNLFYTENKKLEFEINKPNILNQNLQMTDEILLMGGTDIDVADIYMK